MMEIALPGGAMIRVDAAMDGAALGRVLPALTRPSSNHLRPLYAQARSPTHKPHPNSGCCEFDEREVVVVVLFEARGDGAEVFE